MVANEADQVLTLPEAAAKSGYGTDHIGRLVQGGKNPQPWAKRFAPCQAGRPAQKAPETRPTRPSGV